MKNDELTFILKMANKEDLLDLDKYYIDRSLEEELEMVFELNYGTDYINNKINFKKEKYKLKRLSFNKLQKYSLEKPNLDYYSFNYSKTLDQISRENMIQESQKRTKASHEKRNK